MPNTLRPINVVGGYAKPYIQKLPNLSISAKQGTQAVTKQAVEKVLERPAINLTPKIISNSLPIANELVEKTAEGVATKVLPLATKLLPVVTKSLPVISTIADLLLNDAPTADEAEALKKAKEKQILLNPSEPAVEVAPAVPGAGFTGGQSPGVLYYVYYTTNRIQDSTGESFIGYEIREAVYGKVMGLRIENDDSSGNSFKFLVVSSTYYAEPRYIRIAQAGGQTWTLRSASLVRVDEQPDTGGDPPQAQPATYSSPGTTQISQQALQREVGDRAAPAPLTQQLELPDLADIKPKLDLIPNLKRTEQLPPLPEGEEKPRALPPQPTTKNPPQKPPSPNQNSLDTAPKTGDVTTIYSPSANPGTIQITQPFSIPSQPSLLPNAQPFTPTGTNRTPAPQPVTPAPPKTTPPPEKTPLEQFRQDLEKTINLIPAIANNTSRNAIKIAAKDGVCESFNPGECNADIRQNASSAAGNSANNNTALERILNNTSNAADLVLLPIINNKLGAQVPGGISGFLQRAFQATRLDKIINALTLITTLHNAAMLSRNLGSTLGDLTGQALSVIGIKDENGSALDINAEIGRQVNSLMSTILGAETWAGTKLAWNKANTIISSATQIVFTVRSLWDSSKEILEWTAENTGKIGNALKRFRVVGENAYRWMPEQVTHQNAWALKIERFRNGTDNLDDAASSLQGVLGEVQNIQQEFGELNEQKQRFDTNIANLTPKDRAENKPVADAVAAAKVVSKAPADAANVFRGEGETPDA
jgi:hypothetical protein